MSAHDPKRTFFIIYRTQLFDPSDIENEKKIQAGSKGEPISKFLDEDGVPAEPDASARDDELLIHDPGQKSDLLEPLFMAHIRGQAAD
jgi:hypothetical protein